MSNPLYDALFKPHRDNPAVFLRLHEQPECSYQEFLALAARLANTLVASGATLIQLPATFTFHSNALVCRQFQHTRDALVCAP